MNILATKILFGISIALQLITPVQDTLNPPPKIKQVKVMAVGDIMMHMPQIHSGYDAQTDSYSFNYFFEKVKPILESGDLTIGNLETTLSGKNYGYSGYPRFNAPDTLATALKNTGFDIITTANNHSLDKNAVGLKNTIKTLQKNGLQTTGTNLTKERRNSPLILNKNDIKFAISAYTYGTNGLVEPADEPFLVNEIDKDLIIKDLKKAKASKVDVIIACVHFGYQYKRYPSAKQKELVQFLFENGVDIVLGSHPHVVQEMETYTINNEKKFVIYSLGNFISNQRDRYRDGSIILEMTLEKNLQEDITTLKDITYYPTWVYKFYKHNKWQFQIIQSDQDQAYYDQIISNKSDYNKMIQSYRDISSLLNKKSSND